MKTFLSFSLSLFCIIAPPIVAFGQTFLSYESYSDEPMMADEHYAKFQNAVVKISNATTAHAGAGAVFISRQGHLLTNAHVLFSTCDLQHLNESTSLPPVQELEKECSSAILEFGDRKFRARFNIISYGFHRLGNQSSQNEFLDYAVLKITELFDVEQDDPIPEITCLKSASSYHVGDEAISLGFPSNQNGLRRFVAQKIVQRQQMELGADVGWVDGRLHSAVVPVWTQRLIQLMVPLSPGFSGGPTVNLSGELIGINSIAMALPIQTDQGRLHLPFWGGSFLISFEAIKSHMKANLGSTEFQAAWNCGDGPLRLNNRKIPLDLIGFGQ